MRSIIIVIIATFGLSGCESDQERRIKATEKQINSTILLDWRAGIPLNDLIDAQNQCILNPTLKGCDSVQALLQDIATTLASCRVNQRSALCKAVVRDISKHPNASKLPKADALQLLDHPWYWDMPTIALEAQAGNFEYRKEAALWWWESCKTLIVYCIALLLIFIIAWQWWRQWRSAKQQCAAILARQRAERIEKQKTQKIREEQARLENERQVKLARDAAIAEQQRVASENLARQQTAEAAAKLAAEQTEASMLLASAFKAPTKFPHRQRAKRHK